MEIARITRDGKLTIPAELRKNYKLIPGSKVIFEPEEDGIKIIPLVTQEEIKTNVGFLGKKGKMLKVLLKEKN